jgi:tRNA(Ile)-lysidine synthase
MHMLRGSGSAGLRGMLPVSELPGQPGLWLIRPLLNTSRGDIEAYCDRLQLEPLMDETNTDTTFFRNRLRHDLLPILETYNPTIRERLLTMAAVTAADFDWLQQQAVLAWDKVYRGSGAGWLRVDLAGWQGLPLALRRQTLRMAVGLLRPNLRDIGFETIEQARRVGEKGQVGSESTLPGEMVLSVEYSTLALRLADAEGFSPDLHQLPSHEPLTLPIPGQLTLINGWVLKCEVLEKLDPRFILHNDSPWTAYMDVGKTDSLIVRPRLPGERFQPFGLVGHTKSVKAVMIDDKIPAEFRPRWPIVAGEHLYWIPGAIMDERVRVSPKSARAIKLTIQRIVD